MTTKYLVKGLGVFDTKEQAEKMVKWYSFAKFTIKEIKVKEK